MDKKFPKFQVILYKIKKTNSLKISYNLPYYDYLAELAFFN